MYKAHYTYEEIKAYDFTAAWKVDDKDWVKKRRAMWAQIQDKVFFLCRPMRNKKSMKLIREYFLTGELTSKKLLFSMINSEAYNSRIPFRFENSLSHMLLQFWLSADHSEENFLRIRDSHYYYYLYNHNDDEPVKDIDWVMRQFCTRYYSSCAKVRSVCDYFTKENQDKGPFFGGLEEKLLSYFPMLDPCCIRDWECRFKEALKYWTIDSFRRERSGINSNLTDPLIGFLGGGGQSANVFNPNNHIRFLIEDYIKWSYSEPNKDRNFYIRNFYIRLMSMVAILKNVLITPEGRHPIQMEVAKKLEQGLLIDQVGFSYEKKRSIAAGVEIFNEGKWIVGYKTRPNQYKLNYRFWPNGPGERWIKRFIKAYDIQNKPEEIK